MGGHAQGRARPGSGLPGVGAGAPGEEGRAADSRGAAVRLLRTSRRSNCAERTWPASRRDFCSGGGWTGSTGTASEQGGVLRVLDYKSGLASLPGLKGYQDGALLQTALYMMAVDALSLGPVDSARYRGIRQPGDPANKFELKFSRAAAHPSSRAFHPRPRAGRPVRGRAGGVGLDRPLAARARRDSKRGEPARRHSLRPAVGVGDGHPNRSLDRGTGGRSRRRRGMCCWPPARARGRPPPWWARSCGCWAWRRDGTVIPPCPCRRASRPAASTRSRRSPSRRRPPTT